MNNLNSEKPKQIKIIRKLNGIVISDKMDKTVTVAIVEKRRHPIYHKSYYVTSKIKAHDEKNEAKIGDIVEIKETRPISKYKAWQIVKNVETKDAR